MDNRMKELVELLKIFGYGVLIFLDGFIVGNNFSLVYPRADAEGYRTLIWLGTAVGFYFIMCLVFMEIKKQGKGK